MNDYFRVVISKFLIVVFILFLIPSGTILSDEQEREGLKLIKKGEELFKSYNYRESIKKFIEAEKIVKNEKDLSRIYLGISRSYYAMGLMARVREAINKLASMKVKVSINEVEFPRGYLKIYKEVLAESKKGEEDFVIKTDDQLTAKTPVKKTGIVEKPGIKRKKKKSALLPILLGAAALGAAAVLLGKKSSEDAGSGQSMVTISSSPSGATIYVDGVSKGVTPGSVYVDPGNIEIRLVIEGWGETTTTRSFDNNLDYTFNAQLAPYRYGTALEFNTKSNIGHWRWDVDHSGILYVVEWENSELFLEKYDSQGSEISTTKIMSSNTPYNYWVHFNNENNEFLVLDHTSNNNYAFDNDGNYLGKRISPKVYSMSESVTGEIFVNEDRSTIKRLNAGFSMIETVMNGDYWFLKCSDDGEHIFVENQGTNEIVKVDYDGNSVTSWKSEKAWIRDSYVTSYGTGDTEKVFIITGSYFIEIFNGNGEFLTSTDREASIGKIAEDNSYNIYAFVGNNSFKKFEPTSETEGSGSWIVASALHNRVRTGSSSTDGKGSERINKTYRSGNESEKKVTVKK